MEDIMKIVNSLEDFGLIKGVTQTIATGTNKQKG